MCSDLACHWDNEVFSDGDFGQYNDTHFDCNSCMARCARDDNCWAVECNPNMHTDFLCDTTIELQNDCWWWAPGKCTTSQSSVNYPTCRYYEPQTSRFFCFLKTFSFYLHCTQIMGARSNTCMPPVLYLFSKISKS